ncbi:MAG: hypothetical protein ACO3XO_06560 [Bdellovibrionota bacterium]
MGELSNYASYRIPMNESLSLARGFMEEFVESTGLLRDARHCRRYLWTDAFAVFNFISLFRHTEEKKYLERAIQLVAQVHNVLGHHRYDDVRKGWISGLSEAEGRRHPTAGGLRIGKRLMERHVTEPFDELLEWNRDGQYFHYLTKWAHALVIIAQETDDARYLIQAHDLMKKVLSCFLYVPTTSRRSRIYWKMSIDLTRPLVSSMGHLDPLDGLVMLYELNRAYSPRDDSFRDELITLSEICSNSHWRAMDMLSIGSLMIEAYRMGQLIARGEDLDISLLYDVIHGAYEGLSDLDGVDWDIAPELRLAFRELGLVIGLKAIGRFSEVVLREKGLRDILVKPLVAFERFLPLIGVIEHFWSAPENRINNTWVEHADINGVMMATALVPDAFLELDYHES